LIDILEIFAMNTFTHKVNTCVKYVIYMTIGSIKCLVYSVPELV